MANDQWEEKLARYDQLIQKQSDFERLGKSMPYTSANGHMFSQLNKKGELGIRLSKEQRQQFLKDHNTTLFMAYDTVMQEYVLIPERLFDDMDLLLSYLRDGYAYVKSLKPKTSKK